MKKLLGLLGAMGMVASTGAVVVACGGDVDESGLTFESGKGAADLITAAGIKVTDDGKLEQDYKADAEDEKLGIFGEMVPPQDFDAVKVLFTQTKSWESTEKIAYVFTIEGKKDDTSFKIHAYKGDIVGDDESATVTYNEEFNLKVEIPKAEAELPTLDSVITVPALGEIADKKEATILAAVKAKNSTLNENEVEVSDITDTSAKISVKTGSTVYEAGSVDVEFIIATA